MSTGTDRLSDRAKWALLAGFALGAVILAILCAEAAIRVRQTWRYGTSATVEQLYTVDRASQLRVPIANLRQGHIRTNSLGFRSPEIVVPKPTGTIRIAFLGASTTWCGEVSDNEHTWPDIVVEQLRREFTGANIDYINAGVPGYTVASSIRNLRHRVAPLLPDLIIVYHATNDLSGELRDVAASRGLAESQLMSRGSALGQYSLLWNLAEKNLQVWMAQRKAEAGASRLRVDPSTLGEGFRRGLTELVREAQRDARVVALATFATQLRPEQSRQQQLSASASALYYVPFATPQLLIGAFRRYNDIIAEVARDNGALLIGDEDAIAGDPLHFADTVHFTDAGSRAMADRVTKALLADRAVRALFHGT